MHQKVDACTIEVHLHRMERTDPQNRGQSPASAASSMLARKKVDLLAYHYPCVDHPSHPVTTVNVQAQPLGQKIEARTPSTTSDYIDTDHRMPTSSSLRTPQHLQRMKSDRNCAVIQASRKLPSGHPLKDPPFRPPRSGCARMPPRDRIN